MKFSIRDLLLVTMIVALAVGWWVDRRQLSHLSHVMESQNVELKARRDQDELDLTIAKLKLRQAKALTAKAEAAVARFRAAFDSMPTSQAPAPNPPKD
jgi:hypothetical protein